MQWNQHRLKMIQVLCKALLTTQRLGIICKSTLSIKSTGMFEPSVHASYMKMELLNGNFAE
jgi:hypothetical protein